RIAGDLNRARRAAVSQKLPVSRQQDAIVRLGQLHQGRIVERRVVNDVESEHAKPPGNPPEHGIGDKTRCPHCPWPPRVVPPPAPTAHMDAKPTPGRPMPPTRRAFLQVSASTAAAIALGPLAREADAAALGLSPALAAAPLQPKAIRARPVHLSKVRVTGGPL